MPIRSSRALAVSRPGFVENDSVAAVFLSAEFRKSRRRSGMIENLGEYLLKLLLEAATILTAPI